MRRIASKQAAHGSLVCLDPVDTNLCLLLKVCLSPSPVQKDLLLCYRGAWRYFAIRYISHSLPDFSLFTYLL